MTPDVQKCIDQCYRYLALREHNRNELIIKLKQKKYSDEVINETLEYISENGSLSEERYVRSFIMSNNRKHPEGKTIVLQRLLQKGADRAISKKIIDELYSQDYINELISEAIAKLEKKGLKEEMKLCLLKAGFTSSEIRNVTE